MVIVNVLQLYAAAIVKKILKKSNIKLAFCRFGSYNMWYHDRRLSNGFCPCGNASFFLGFSVFQFALQVIHKNHIIGDEPSQERRILFLVWDYKLFQFLAVPKIFNKTVKITITGDNDSPFIVWIFNHSVQDKLRIDIALYLAIAQNQRWLKNQDITLLL